MLVGSAGNVIGGGSLVAIKLEKSSQALDTPRMVAVSARVLVVGAPAWMMSGHRKFSW